MTIVFSMRTNLGIQFESPVLDPFICPTICRCRVYCFANSASSLLYSPTSDFQKLQYTNHTAINWLPSLSISVLAANENILKWKDILCPPPCVWVILKMIAVYPVSIWWSATELYLQQPSSYQGASVEVSSIMQYKHVDVRQINVVVPKVGAGGSWDTERHRNSYYILS